MNEASCMMGVGGRSGCLRSAAGSTYITHEPLKHHQLSLESLDLLVHLLLNGFGLLRSLQRMEMGKCLGGPGTLIGRRD